MRIAFALAFVLLPGLGMAQNPPPSDDEALRHLPAPVPHSGTNAALQTSVEHLAETNTELLDLLKKQQAVLEDIQFDRRLQSRQIQALEERLQSALIENAQLKGKIDKLNSAIANPTAAGANSPGNVASSNTNQAPAAPKPPPLPPASALPAPPNEGMPGSPAWHRLFTLSGGDNRTTDLFHITGHQWRVLWHNKDPDGQAYENTSALFINAFPRDDTIPQKVSAKLGSGGDSTQLVGPGNFYLKIEASGGSWELAVEEFR